MRGFALLFRAMHRFASLFGEVLLYQHQRVIIMTKVYIASNNLPVEIIHKIRYTLLISGEKLGVQLKIPANIHTFTKSIQ